jgi:hypothetical protein
VKFKCRTLFDITATGVTGHYKSTKVPFKDHAGQEITDALAWNRSRNQQRNWETLTQLIAMRAQIFEMSRPVKHELAWEFEFAVETPAVFGDDISPTGVLEADARDIPMLNNLSNAGSLEPVLVAQGPTQNIWFEVVPINNESEE